MRTVEVRSGGVHLRCTVELFIGGEQLSCIWVNLSRAWKHLFFCHFTWCTVLLVALQQKLVKQLLLDNLKAK